MNKKFNNQVRFQPRTQLQKYQRKMIKANNQIKHQTAQVSTMSRIRNQTLEKEKIRKEWEQKFGFLAAVVLNAENEKAKGKSGNETDWTICLMVIVAALAMLAFLCLGILVLQ